MMQKVPKDFKDINICVVGLGYVGLTFAVNLAESGFNVTGLEINEKIIESLDNNVAHFFEPGLNDKIYVVKSSGSFRYQKDFDDSIQANVFIITVGTPLTNDGKVNLKMIQRVTKQIANTMPQNSLIVGRSTVKVGTMNEVVKPILDYSKKDYELVFCPERTLEGKALEELKILPQIIGADRIESIERASKLFSYVTNTNVRVSNLKTAEMIKLIDNTSRDVKFAFSNEVAQMCENLGISAYEVIVSGKQGYPRTNLPLPGPVGGPCLSKDPHILIESLEKTNFKPKITSSSRIINEMLPSYVTNQLSKLLNHKSNLKISLLGLAFKGKPETDDLRGSMSIPMIKTIKEVFTKPNIYGWDPIIDKQIINDSLKIIGTSSFIEAFEAADLVIIMNNHEYFSNISLESLSKKMMLQGIIYDFWNHFSHKHLELNNDVKYLALGTLKGELNL